MEKTISKLDEMFNKLLDMVDKKPIVVAIVGIVLYKILNKK